MSYKAENGLWGGGTPYSGPYREAPPRRGTFFRLQVYKRLMVSLFFEVYERVGKLLIVICART